MRISSRAGCWALAATMSWCAAVSAAAPDAERLKTAAEEFDAGRRAFKIRDFENSAIHFENADRDAPSPEALQSAMRARKEAGQAARAATLAALALSRYPRDAAASTYARQVLSEVERALQKVNIACRPECSVIVDNRVMPFPESPAPVVYLDPGRHTVIADWPNNRNKAVEVVATAGETSQLTFQAMPASEHTAAEKPAVSLVPAAALTPESSANSPSTRLPVYVFVVGAGVTAVLGGITLWSGIDTINNPGKDEVTRSCVAPNNNTSCPEYQAGLGHQRRTNVLIAATGVAGLTTAVLGIFFTDWVGSSPNSAKGTVGWQPVVGLTDGVTVGAVGSF